MKFIVSLLVPALLLTTGMQVYAEDPSHQMHAQANEVAQFTIRNPTPYRILLHDYHNNLSFFFEPGEIQILSLPILDKGSGNVSFYFLVSIWDENGKKPGTGKSGAPYSTDRERIAKGAIRAHFSAGMTGPGEDFYPPVSYLVVKLVFDS